MARACVGLPKNFQGSLSSQVVALCKVSETEASMQGSDPRRDGELKHIRRSE